MGLLGCGVDGEDHTLTAVVAGLAVEPKRLGRHDLHRDLGRRDDGVVGVRLRVGVHAAVERVAGRGEAGLGGGVHLAHELEDNHVTDGSLDLLGGEDQAGITANDDGVGGLGRRLGSSGGYFSNGLGHDDLLVNRGRLGSLSSGVRPDNDDLRRALRGETTVYPRRLIATNLLENIAARLPTQVVISLGGRVNVVNSLSERHGGDGH